ncbi:YSIRK-type signal peptide-containing protein [Streptococcus pseudopneumoniae]|uniref:YSIRK-type signal peptide-containing protein n=1 Tax=Streptococcus pseudopneumoniae TaxID=257758 RepID=UPI00110C20D7|nr:YSIRK-type signal peptide-containing protein [Streptococcus pseudopneumoniae]TMR85730.1 YSIRK-type signal peptide-containing protein [Streptococcus pseudopneumoniae]
MRARHERRNRYSIRKFSVGVASVVVATFFCVGGGGQVVQAADGARLQGVSSPLDPYRKDLQDRLENLSLSEKDKEGYRDKIKKATDHFKLVELDQLLTQLQEQETQDAVDKAKTALPKHMTTRLEEVDQSGSTFPNLLEKLKNVITKYSGLFDDALNRKKVEELEQRAQEEMDTHIAEYKKGLTAAPGDNKPDAGKDQAGKDQAGKDQAGDGNPADKDQAGDGNPADKDQAGKDPADKDQAGKDQAGKDQAGKDQAGKDQAGKDQAGKDPADKDQAGKDQAGKDQAGKDQAGKDQAGKDQAGKDQAGDGNPADKDQAGKDPADKDQAGKDPADKDQAGDAGKPSPRNQTFTGTVGSVSVTVLFDKPVGADKVTVKEITEKDLVDRISRQAGGGSIRLFDLSLTKNGKETHVNEERTVRLALEGLGGDVQVYHVRPDGQLEPIPSRVEDGHVIFRINHFSLFAIKTMSSKSGQETPSNQATPGTQAKSTPTETTKDATSKKTLPNTGTADSTALLAAAASTAILGLGLAGRRRKED